MKSTTSSGSRKRVSAEDALALWREYKTTGSVELADEVAKHVGDRAAVLMANHGLFVVGRDAAQALEFLKPLRPGRGVEKAYRELRTRIDPCGSGS